MSGHSHAPNKKSQYVILGMTFLMGFVMGVILFLYNNTGENSGALDGTTKGFEISAYMYGGCGDGVGCPSYRISDNGSYEYIVRKQGVAEARFDEKLNSAQIKSLHDRVAASDFNAITQTKFTDECPANLDGIAYRYEIEYAGVRYSLDSCVQDLGANILFGSLQDYFEFFRIAHSAS